MSARKLNRRSLSDLADLELNDGVGINDPTNSNWGSPNNLTTHQTRVLEKFTAWVNLQTSLQASQTFPPHSTPPPTVASCVNTFSKSETPTSASLRFLRARKFQYDDTRRMVLQGRLLRCSEIGVDRAFNSYDYREKWKELDPDEVLSVSFLHEPVSVHPNSPVGMSYWREGGWFEGRSTSSTAPPLETFLTHYPQGYFGKSKRGDPLWICRVGNINARSLTTFTNMRTVLQYHWYAMEVEFSRALAENCAEDKVENQSRCLLLLDLKNITLRFCTNKLTLAELKCQAQIDSLCFPEIMERAIVLNAPAFFKVTWGIVKGFVDPRTGEKVEFVSGKNSINRIRELCNVNTLPSDYGGRGKRMTMVEGESAKEEEQISGGEEGMVTVSNLLSIGGKRASSCTATSDEIVIGREGGATGKLSLKATVHTMVHGYVSKFVLLRRKRRSSLALRRSSSLASVDLRSPKKGKVDSNLSRADDEWEEVKDCGGDVINTNPKAAEVVGGEEFSSPETNPHFNEPIGVDISGGGDGILCEEGEVYKVKGTLVGTCWNGHDYLVVVRILKEKEEREEKEEPQSRRGTQFYSSVGFDGIDEELKDV